MRTASLSGPIAVRVFQLAIAGVLVVGLAWRSVGVTVNAVLALGVTFLPAVLERDYSIPLRRGVTLWITAAVLLHAVGMLGPYHSVWWWDHVTHAMSAAVVAGVGYATVTAIDEHMEAIYLPSQFLFVLILLFTLSLGVLWELLEFGARQLAEASGVEPVLVQYSLEDTVVDLIFDMVGAVLVALFGGRELSPIIDSLVDRLERARQG